MKSTNQGYKEQLEKIAEVLDLGTPELIGTGLFISCPFHIEDKPSFRGDIEKGYIKCFGAECQVGTKMHLETLADNLRGNIVQEEVQNISKYKVKTYIDAFSYKEKPNKEEIGKITSRISDYPENFKEWQINELAYYIVNGHTVAPAGIRKKEEWKEQQIVMLDFDNKGDTNFTRAKVLEYAKKIKLEPTFAYYTFNHLKGEEPKNKFRFVYCFTEPITDRRKIECIIKYLHNRFEKFKPDLACKDLDRKFIGTNNQDIWSSNYLYKPSDRFTEEQLDAVEQIIAPSKKEQQKNKSIKGITSITAKELLSKELEQPAVIVDNLLKQGLCILSGAPKVGKSWLCLDLCLSVAKGEPFLGFNTNKSECLYLALEDSYSRLQDRLRKVLKDAEVPDDFNLSISCSPLDNGLLEELEDYLQQKPNIKLIIIDTLQKIRGSQSKNDSCYSYDYKEIGKLKAFADNHKITIVVIHHLRKQKDSDVFNQVSGSTGLTGAADTMIVLDKTGNENKEVLLSVTGRDIDSIEHIITFDKTAFKWKLNQSLLALEAKKKKESYLRNPIVKTIKTLLEMKPDGIKLTATELLEQIKLITGTEPKQNQPNSLSRIINDKLQFQLQQYDGIYYEPPNEHGGNGGRKMFFSKTYIEEQPEDADVEAEQVTEEEN